LSRLSWLNGCRWALPALSLIAACSGPVIAPPGPLSDTPIQAAWVVLGEQGSARARVITSAATCPDLMQDGVALPMAVRAPAATIAQRRTASAASDSKSSEFLVLTCEAVLGADVHSLQVGGRTLPPPVAQPQKIVVIADTGCRLKKADNVFQSCNDETIWPLKPISDRAAAFKPDLVIHIGDYHYRENPCPNGQAACAGSPWGYGWDTWNADMFTPMASLLGAAPWVMVRGNHETCVRAGQGWWRFLDPRALEAGRDCNLEANDLQADYSAPYAVPLGGDAQLIVFDSAKVPYKPLASSDAAYQIYLDQFKLVNRLSERAGFNIFLSHHPALGFGINPTKDGQVEITPGSVAMQTIMQGINPKRLFPDNIQIAMAGHVHLFEAIGFASDHPTQFVSGNGGSTNDIGLPNILPAGATPFSEAVVDVFRTTNTYGFMTMERQGRQWLMKSWDRNGKLMTSCTHENKKISCVQ
jgi:hypothetical protein